MTLEELKEKVESIEINYDYEEVYNSLYNAVIDYMNDSQDFDLESLFNDIVDYDTAEEIAKHELKDGGLVRLYYFLGDANCNNNLFIIDGYGNLRDLELNDLECLKEDLLDAINDKLEEV